MKTRLLCSGAIAAVFLLAAQSVAAQTTVNEVGALEAGDEKIATGEFIDGYMIEGQAGDLLEVQLSSDDFDTYLIVSGPGSARFENDDAAEGSTNSGILERLPESGSYRLAVTSYQPGETGAYTLRASTLARPINTDVADAESGELANGDERLESGEYSDSYSFTAAVGDPVEIRLNSDEFDTYLMLRGPSGASFENDDQEPGNSNSLISATIPASGDYRIHVTSYAPEETGRYDLAVTGADITAMPNRGPRARFGGAGSGTNFLVGTPVNGSLSATDQKQEDGEFFDIYTLQADPGARLVVRMESPDFDTYLAAFGSDGFEAANDDDAEGEGTDSRLEAVVPLDGVLTIAATSYAAGTTGSYVLSAEVSAGDQLDFAGSQPLELGGVAEGTLGTADDSGQRRYVLVAQAGQEVDFTLSSPDFDTILRIDGPGGFSIENDDDPRMRTLDSHISTQLPQAGSYLITVSSYASDASGSYRLTSRTAAAASDLSTAEAQALVLGEKISGALAAGDNSYSSGEFVDFYQFEGQRGQRLNFEMESADFDTFLSLNFPNGGEERNDDRAGRDDTNSRLSITLPEDGTYRLGATSYAAGEQGAYTLSMELLDDAVRAIAPTSSDARVFALSVGVADYERMDTLDLTDRDAQKLAQTLAAAGVLAPESVTLVNARATRENFTAAFNTISAAIRPDDLLMVFFSGHGDKVEGVDTELDGSSETIELFDAPLHDYELAELFAGIDARTLLVIDACFSGGFDNIIDQRVDRMGIFSSDSDVLSLVADKFEAGGYVSLLLRQALEGGADTNGDRAITAGELSEFMRLGFYRIALEAPLEAGGEDFRGESSLGYQHLIVDRGGDGMPYGQVLLHLNGSQGGGESGVAKAAD